MVFPWKSFLTNFAPMRLLFEVDCHDEFSEMVFPWKSILAKSQSWGFFFRWTAMMCSWRLPFSENLFWQNSHSWGFFLGCLNIVRKPHRLLLMMLMLLLMLASNFITRDWLDLGQIFKKHMTSLIFMNFLKKIRNVFFIFRKCLENISTVFRQFFEKILNHEIFFENLLNMFRKIRIYFYFNLVPWLI